MYTLRDYQQVAVEQSLDCFDVAKRNFIENRQQTAIVLSAPTGAGKTIMTGDVIDKLLSPRNGVPSEMVVLWVTDNPSLNRQSAKRMIASTDESFPMTMLTGSGDKFDKAKFETGNLYLLNTQAASDTAGMSVKERGTANTPTGREFTIWETIRNTINEHGANFVVMIDEAHRGVEKEEEGKTIIGRIIEKVPVVYGISATEQRFVNWMSKKHRHVELVKVSITDVRNAGIIKSNLIVSDTVDGKEAHVTLLKDAVRQTMVFDKSWERYCKAKGIERIYPLLVVQVEDSGSDPGAQTVFAYDIDRLIKGILDEWSELTDDSIVHTFAERKTLVVRGLSGGSRTVRYMSPDLIDESKDVRVVLAKTAIATGWDCPRAEVLVSFRGASDETYITQLIGRMIRQPLGERVAMDESLNSTYCTLPNFDQAAVAKITQRLRDEEGAALDVANMRPITYDRSILLPQSVFDSLLEVPSYDVPSGASASQVGSLRRFAAALSRDGININAPEFVSSHISAFLDQIPADRSRVFEKAIADVMLREQEAADDEAGRTVTVSRSKIAIEDDSTVVEGEPTVITKDLLDAEHGFIGDSVLPPDVRVIYQVHLIERGLSLVDANRRIKAYNFGRLGTLELINASAEEISKGWILEFQDGIGSRMAEPDPRYAIYREIVGRHNEPVTTHLPIVPLTIQENIDDDLKKIGRRATSTDDPIIVRKWIINEDQYRYDKHLFTSEEAGDRYVADFGGIRKHVLKNYLSDFSCVGWYNNPSFGHRSITVPWIDEEEEWKEMHPDFILFYESEDGGIKPSIVDILTDSAKEKAQKLKWWSWYAAKHGEALHSLRVAISGKSGGSDAQVIDLTNVSVRSALAIELGRHNPDFDIFFREHGS